MLRGIHEVFTMYKSIKINEASKRASQSNILNLPILSTLLLILFSVALSACGGGGGGEGSSDRRSSGGNMDADNDGVADINDAFPLDNSRSTFRVGNLRAIPGVTNITLTWDNPAANIRMINISYIPTAGSNLTTELLTEYQGNSVIVSNQKNVTAAVTGLTNGTQYTFSVSAILNGTDAAKNTEGVNVNRTIGANFDNDDEPNSIDADDDNDGVADINDAFPLDNSRSTFRVGNLRAIPGVTNITLTWDNPAANISMINISYISTAGGILTTKLLTEYQGASIIGSNQKNVTAAITGLTDGIQYNFTVTPILGGADAAKNTAGVNVNRTIGANFDNDDEPNSIDADDDNDGVADINDAFPKDSTETTDNDTDGTGDNADAFPNDPTETTDTDGDGTGDNADAFPMDNSRSAFRVGNLRAIPDVTNIILTWDNPAASISMINVSYIATSDGTNRVTQTLTTYQGNSIIGNNQKDVTAAVTTGLTDGTQYNFTVTPILGGADAAKNSAGVNAIRTIGANFDNDDEPDSIDADDDNDGVSDGADAFPMNSAETKDTDGDNTGDNADMDDDGDNHLDTVDVDDDGDGLIEIHNAAELDQVRHNLAGNSSKATMDATGDVTGCGGLNTITTCSGYELAAPIDLSAIDNWQPLGECANVGCTIQTRFTATFDGNGHIINGLTINSTDSSRLSIALFGAIEDAKLRNIHLRNASVNINHDARTAMLVGDMRGGAIISNSSAQGSVITKTSSAVGGLVGRTSANSAISYSYVFNSIVSGRGAVGGLAGFSQSVISSSYVSNTVVSGAGSVGGLVGGLFGGAQRADIRSSYASNTAVSGDGDQVGGLVGYFLNADISSSYVSNTAVSGAASVGGLLGYLSTFVANYNVTSSYVLNTSVSGSNYVGGLVGRSGFFNTDPFTVTINSTYVAQVEVHSTDSNIGGLVGKAPPKLKIANSYWQGMIFIDGVQDNSRSIVAGTEKMPSELQTSEFTGNYADWGGFWCDADSGEFTDDSNSPLVADENRAWVLAPSAVSASFPAVPHISRYPTLRCTPGGAAAQYTQRLGIF